MLSLGTGQTRPPRELAILSVVAAAGWLAAWLIGRAIDFDLLALFRGWAP